MISLASSAISEHDLAISMVENLGMLLALPFGMLILSFVAMGISELINSRQDS